MNVYLIESNSRVLIESELKRIIASSKNKIIYNALDATLEDIISEASYVSMFEEMKYLVIKNANFFGTTKLKEKEEELLLRYLNEPYPLCTMIFVTYDSVDSRKKITKVIKEKHHYKKILSPKGLDLYQKVNHLLIEKKYTAEKDTINYIINVCLSNLDLIANEIEKIDLYYGRPTKLELEPIKKIVSKTLTENQFKLIDAIIEKDLKKSKQLMNELMALKVEPLSIINLLAREYRLLLEIKSMEKKHYSEKEKKEELRLQDWQIEKLEKEASHYHEEDIKDYLIGLEKIDYKIKTGELDKWISLDLFLLNLYEY